MQLNKDFVSQIQRIIANAQVKAIRSVNFERVLMYWQIGEAIVEEEQNGKELAEYGAYLIDTLAKAFFIINRIKWIE